MSMTPICQAQAYPVRIFAFSGDSQLAETHTIILDFKYFFFVVPQIKLRAFFPFQRKSISSIPIGKCQSEEYITKTNYFCVC